uniref:Uncharacterized protein n=1 Tax=Rhizophora mucronata TaxID=61149 RepID=A0A2P2N0A9_RHIMU
MQQVTFLFINIKIVPNNAKWLFLNKKKSLQYH